MQDLLARLSRSFPRVIFTPSDRFMWSPSDQTLHYDSLSMANKKARYTLLHELGHALLNHTSYQADTELISLELEAWNKAKELAREVDVDIPEDYIEDCLDSYRDWLLARSKCPSCDLAGLQSLRDLSYSCVNCSKTWSVPADQTCAIRRVTN